MFRKRLKYLGYGHPAIAGFGDRGCDFLIKSLLYLGSILRLSHILFLLNQLREHV